MRTIPILTSLTLVAGLAAQAATGVDSDACTSIMVSAGATTDGSTMITYSADAPFMPRLLHVPAAEHEPGTRRDVWGWEDERIRGQVAEARRTYRVVGLINEHQLALGETTTGGRRELRDRGGLLDYDALMLLTLQRAKTAGQAITTIDALCREYGYGSSGETFAIADPREVWVMELIGKGPDDKGIVWVAARVPDGYISASANMARITTFPLDDPANWRYAPDVIEFATRKGYYDEARDGEFSWRHVYHPDPSPVKRRVCGARVWSIYRRAAPSQEWPVGWHRGERGAEDYALFVEPDQKLGVRDVMTLMRDHYEGTPYDMTKGIAAGPFGSPYRFRDLTWQVDDATYCWERPIATQQAGFVMLAQCRGWLPDPVGGVYWFTPDDCYTSCFLPLYCGIGTLPAPYVRGDYERFSWDSAWWVTNMVSNLAYDRWSRVIPDIRAAQRKHELAFLQRQKVIDKMAVELARTDPDGLEKFLTDTALSHGEQLFRDWRELATEILTKNVDGYMRQDDGRRRGVGYPEAWRRRVADEKGTELGVEGGRRP